MSFQAYLDNIELKTGKTPQHFVDEAKNKGFDETTKSGEIIQWLSHDYGLGRGHAMALVHVIKHGAQISEKHVNSGTVHSDPTTVLKLDGVDTLPAVGAPAQAAFEAAGITNAVHLAQFTERELLALHGVGPKAVKLLKQAGVKLKEN